MKLYHINPNDYGQEFYVCSNNAKKALISVKDWLEKASKINSFYEGYYRLFKTSTLINLPLKYSIEEYEPNVVARSEIS